MLSKHATRETAHDKCVYASLGTNITPGTCILISCRLVMNNELYKVYHQNREIMVKAYRFVGPIEKNNITNK